MDLATKQNLYSAFKKLSQKVAMVLTSAWSDDDFKTTIFLSKKSRMDPFDLIAVSTNESGLSPAARNPTWIGHTAVAVGLNQINKDAAAAMGRIPRGNDDAWNTFADAVVKMSVTEQLPLVFAYFDNSDRAKKGRPWTNAVQIYAENAAGGITTNVDVTDATIIYPGGTPNYDGNTGLDLANEGNITGKSLRLVLERIMTTPVYRAAAYRMAIPSMRYGYAKGWADGSGRFPASSASPSDGYDPVFYALAYNEGYDAASRAPAGSAGSLPDFLK